MQARLGFCELKRSYVLLGGALFVDLFCFEVLKCCFSELVLLFSLCFLMTVCFKCCFSAF